MVTVQPTEEGAFPLRFRRRDGPDGGRSRLHLDLSSASADDQRRTVARALALGGRHLDVGQRPEELHVVLADPEGHAFCVVEPGNAFLVGCGRVGALACDGSAEVGRYWRAALGWPPVWDVDEETAVQSPAGGPKISWGGPPVPPLAGRDPLHLDLAAVGPRGLAAEVDRLVGLGAVRLGPSSCAPGAELADPDANAFCLLRAG